MQAVGRTGSLVGVRLALRDDVHGARCAFTRPWRATQTSAYTVSSCVARRVALWNLGPIAVLVDGEPRTTSCSVIRTGGRCIRRRFSKTFERRVRRSGPPAHACRPPDRCWAGRAGHSQAVGSCLRELHPRQVRASNGEGGLQCGERGRSTGRWRDRLTGPSLRRAPECVDGPVQSDHRQPLQELGRGHRRTPECCCLLIDDRRYRVEVGLDEAADKVIRRQHGDT